MLWKLKEIGKTRQRKMVPIELNSFYFIFFSN